MKLLAEISDGSLGLSGEFELLGMEYRLRKSARVILLNDKGEMAVQHVRTHNYHKLPGGGIEVGESIEAALKREVQEEVGCDCMIGRPVGIIIEYRNKAKLLSISYCYVANVVGEIGDTALETGEIEAGQETVWLMPTDLLIRMKSDVPGEYKGHFIVKREMSFIEEYLHLVN